MNKKKEIVLKLCVYPEIIIKEVLAENSNDAEFSIEITKQEIKIKINKLYNKHFSILELLDDINYYSFLKDQEKRTGRLQHKLTEAICNKLSS